LPKGAWHLLATFWLVWGGKMGLWYNEKNIIGFGVGFLKW